MYVCALLLDGAEDGPCKVVGDDLRLILRNVSVGFWKSRVIKKS